MEKRRSEERVTGGRSVRVTSIRHERGAEDTGRRDERVRRMVGALFTPLRTSPVSSVPPEKRRNGDETGDERGV